MEYIRVAIFGFLTRIDLKIADCYHTLHSQDSLHLIQCKSNRCVTYSIAMCDLFLASGGEAKGQAAAFTAGFPKWTGAPNRKVETTMNWSVMPGQSVDKVEIAAYQVTIVGGVRTETLVGLVNDSAPPAIPAMGNFSHSQNLAMAGVYCVRIRLYYSVGMMNDFLIILSSPNETL